MDFSDLYRLLRQEAKRRIAAKEITQSALARKMRVSQPTLSNFLKDKDNGEPFKNINHERWDALMKAMDLTVEHFTNTKPSFALADKRFVPFVSQLTAIRRPSVTKRFIQGRSSITYSEAQEDAGKHTSLSSGDRFVAIKATAHHGFFLSPIIEVGYTLIIDRHDVKLVAFQPNSPVIFAVSDGDFLRVGYLQQIGSQLQLTPYSRDVLPIPITLSTSGIGARIIGSVNTIVQHRKGEAIVKQRPKRPNDRA
jgi:transcriptional regulator with XRE-family HTH domain